MTLSRYIELHLAAIYCAWERAACAAHREQRAEPSRSLGSAAHETLDLIAVSLRADARGEASADVPPFEPSGNPAAQHGSLRQRQGVSAAELAHEFALLRTVVMREWQATGANPAPEACRDVTRFHALVDEALVSALRSHSAAAAQSRDTFLAVIGHDLRNPLGSLAGCLELLERPSLPQAQRRRSTEIARRSVATIQGMVADLLEYTRSRLGQSLHIAPVVSDIAALCREAVEEMQAAYSDRRFTARVPDSLPAAFDVSRMRQVLTNLLSNAVHHGEPGSPIALSASRVAKGLTIEVKNAGEPIPPELMKSIFDPLVQIPTAASAHPRRPATSLGLGLFIAREITAAHGGQIDVASSSDAGTTFTVVLPRQPRPASGPEVARASATSP